MDRQTDKQIYRQTSVTDRHVDKVKDSWRKGMFKKVKVRH